MHSLQQVQQGIPMEAQKVTFKSQRKAPFQQDLSGGYSASAHILTPPSLSFLSRPPVPEGQMLQLLAKEERNNHNERENKSMPNASTP